MCQESRLGLPEQFGIDGTVASNAHVVAAFVELSSVEAPSLR
jgi:hypothetical protein